jgi:hypothetical protein
MKLQTGTRIRRKETARIYTGILAEIVGFNGGSMYEVCMLEGRQAGLHDQWDSRNFSIELPREPDWEI